MIKEKLASSIGRRDEEPNIELAKTIVSTEDHQSVQDLIELLKSKQKELQNDSIKVLYEIGELSAELIVKYLPDFIDALKSKNNRLQWGAMTALKAISSIETDFIYQNIFILEQVVNQGSVISRDNFIGILTNLLDKTEYSDQAFGLLLQQLKDCPTNQLPMYAELSVSKIKLNHHKAFKETVMSRLDEMEKESKRKRLEKVLKKLG